MGAEAYREDEMYRETEPDMINIKRNPYLVDYEQEIRRRGYREHEMPQGQRRQRTFQGRPQQDRNTRVCKPRQGSEIERIPRRTQRTTLEAPEETWEQGVRRMPQRELQQSRGMGEAPQRRPQQSRGMGEVPQRRPQQSRGMERAPQRRPQYTQEVRRARADMEKRRAAARRRRIVRMQRMVLFAGVFCIALLCGILYMKRIYVKAEASGGQETLIKETDVILPTAAASGMVQGISATDFAKHPEWEENFLTLNEYSRPGEALEEVNNIFVHYTANPNTSAAQNRSYFEQLKDTHITSASAHFIIGYNGEIVQCIPLDEIAYAVQTRNYDSVSIECCYKSADGSFTQETYDSLIELLAWLTDAYDLTTDDILRHYDCGGKKCPIYYTEHEDAWEKLKSDVNEKL